MTTADAKRSVARPNAAGFTLVEVLVVLAILTLTAAMTLPVMRRPPDGVRLESAARDIASTLRLSRAVAIVRNEDVDFTIDVERKIMQSSSVPPVQIDNDISIEIVFAAPQRRARDAGTIRFFADGTSSGGDILLEIGRRRARISVPWSTGAARLDLAGINVP
jgi:general secretion pathway protein H